MKYTFALSAFAALVAAGPIDTRQIFDRVGTTENEFTQGGCRDIIFFFARGSTEIGNMVCSKGDTDTQAHVTHSYSGLHRRSTHRSRTQGRFRLSSRRRRRYRLRRSSVNQRSSGWCRPSRHSRDGGSPRRRSCSLPELHPGCWWLQVSNSYNLRHASC